MNKKNVESDIRVKNMDLSMDRLKSYLNRRYSPSKVPIPVKKIFNSTFSYDSMRDKLGYEGRLVFANDIFMSLEGLDNSYKMKLEPYVKDLMRSLYFPELLDDVSEVKRELSSSYLPNVRGLIATLSKIQDGDVHVFSLDEDLDDLISKAKIDLMQTQGMLGVEVLLRVRERLNPYL